MAKYMLQFLIAIILISCNTYTPTEEELKKIESDIYRTLASPHCDSGIVYINPEITSYKLSNKKINYLKNEYPNISKETLDGYVLKNSSDREVVELFSKFTLDCEYKFIDLNSEEFMVCNDAGCITPIGFSPIGFNESYNEAMVHMYWVCSECGGWGRIYFLEKKGDSWIVVNFVQLSVS